MNDEGLPRCRHRGTAVARNQWSCHSPKVVVPGGVVTREICSALCPYVDHEPDRRLERLLRQFPPADDGGSFSRWPYDRQPVTPRPDCLAIAMLTAPRPVRTVDRSLTELRRAGFTQPIRVFAEPDTEVTPAPDVSVTVNPRRLGMWANWRQAAEWLLNHSSAPFLLICEDDIRLSRDASLALLHAINTLPHDDWGYASLYAPAHNFSILGRQPEFGWQALALAGGAWGSLAYCLSRSALAEMLASSIVRTHAGDRETDSVVSSALGALERKCYFHVPSLCEHAGAGISSVGHVPQVGMDAVKFSPDSCRYASTAQFSVKLEEPPLVSCVMPTGNRHNFALQAIRYFQRQTYPNRELVIIDDGDRSLDPSIPADPRIRCFRVPPGLSIGAKRNLACEHSRGTILVQWDDDDWYGPWRLAAQVAPQICGDADVTAIEGTLFFELPRWEFWCCSPAEHGRMFFAGVSGGTLAFRREVWERGRRYPDQSLAEDAVFLNDALTRGARLAPIPNDGHFIYVRHGANTWRFECGGFRSAGDWWRVAEVSILQADRDFYQLQRGAGCTTLAAQTNQRELHDRVGCE